VPALDVLRLEAPVIQAGMGGVAGHELAAAVSEAGGLGTIAGVRADIADEIAAARRLTGRPIAVNLLLPHAGGRFGVPGDYLFQDSAAFGNYQGLWGILRVTP